MLAWRVILPTTPRPSEGRWSDRHHSVHVPAVVNDVVLNERRQTAQVMRIASTGELVGISSSLARQLGQAIAGLYLSPYRCRLQFPRVLRIAERTRVALRAVSLTGA